MKWPGGVRKSGGGWRAVIMLDDGELLELGVWGLKPDAIEAYNWHLAWLGWTGRCCRCQRTQGISNGSSWIGSGSPTS
jgi:hypothetical protein